MHGDENGDGRCQVGRRAERRIVKPWLTPTLAMCVFLNCFASLNVFWDAKGVCSGVSNGAGSVLLALKGRILGLATCQKVHRPALANANISLVCLLLRFSCL